MHRYIDTHMHTPEDIQRSYVHADMLMNTYEQGVPPRDEAREGEGEGATLPLTALYTLGS